MAPAPISVIFLSSLLIALSVLVLVLTVVSGECAAGTEIFLSGWTSFFLI